MYIKKAGVTLLNSCLFYIYIYSKLIAINEIFIYTPGAGCCYLMNNLADTIPAYVLEKTTP